MINVAGKLVDNNLTKNELLNKVVIQKTDSNDFNQICNILYKAFELSSPKEAMGQLYVSDVLINQSVKIVDSETKEIYGLLIFCEYPITVGSPIYKYNYELGKHLNQFNQINGHSFIIDERLRGCGFDSKMLLYNMDYIKANYDFIWCGVEASLGTDNYWKRKGFFKLFEIPEASFYILPFDEKVFK